MRDRLGEKLLQSLGEEFIDPEAGELIPAGTGEESIFGYDSVMGKLPESDGDHWIYDEAASTWTRIIVVPRKRCYHPGEGLGEDRIPGPVLDDLLDLRKTITTDGQEIQDDWRTTEESDGPSEALEEWTGECVFRV